MLSHLQQQDAYGDGFILQVLDLAIPNYVMIQKDAKHTFDEGRISQCINEVVQLLIRDGILAHQEGKICPLWLS